MSTVPSTVKQLLCDLDLKKFNAKIVNVTCSKYDSDKLLVQVEFTTFDGLDKHWAKRIKAKCAITIKGSKKDDFIISLI
jgi:hypothetical protein